MAEFFLDKTPLPDGTFTIHRKECAQFPAFDAIDYLGSYSNAEAAHVKADGLQSGAVFCPTCLTK